MLLNVSKMLLYLRMPIIKLFLEFEGRKYVKRDVMGLRKGCLIILKILKFPLIRFAIDVLDLCIFEAKMVGYILRPIFKNLFFNEKKL